MRPRRLPPSTSSAGIEKWIAEPQDRSSEPAKTRPVYVAPPMTHRTKSPRTCIRGPATSRTPRKPRQTAGPSNSTQPGLVPGSVPPSGGPHDAWTPDQVRGDSGPGRHRQRSHLGTRRSNSLRLEMMNGALDMRRSGVPGFCGSRSCGPWTGDRRSALAKLEGSVEVLTRLISRNAARRANDRPGFKLGHIDNLTGRSAAFLPSCPDLFRATSASPAPRPHRDQRGCPEQVRNAAGDPSRCGGRGNRPASPVMVGGRTIRREPDTPVGLAPVKQSI